MDWNNKNEILKAVSEDGLNLEYIPNKFKKDKDFMLEVISNVDILDIIDEKQFTSEDIDKYISTELRNDKDFILKLIENDSWNLFFASDELKNNKEIVLEAIKKDGYALQFASEEIKDNFDICLKAVQTNSFIFPYLSDNLKGNITIARIAVEDDFENFYEISENLKNNKFFIFNIIDKYESYISKILKEVSDELKRDKDFCEKCLDYDEGWYQGFEFFDKEVSKEILIENVKDNPEFINTIKPIFDEYYSILINKDIVNLVDFVDDLYSKTIEDININKMVIGFKYKLLNKIIKNDFDLNSSNLSKEEIYNIKQNLEFNKEFCKKLLKNDIECKTLDLMGDSIKMDVIYESIKEDISVLSNLVSAVVMEDCKFDDKTKDFIITLDSCTSEEINNFKIFHSYFFEDNNLKK